MRYKITDHIVRDNEELSHIPELKDLSNRTLKYIMYMYDYDSPYRNIPLDKRKDRVLALCGFKKETDGSRWDRNARDVRDEKGLADPIKVFVEVQDNIEKQLVASYDLQLTEFMDLFKKKDKSDKDREMALKVMKELPSFVAKRKELMEIIGQRTQEVLVEKKESTLEKINKSKIHERSKEEFEG